MIMYQYWNTVPWTYVIEDFNDAEIVVTFFKKELQKTNQEKFRIEKVIKKKSDKLYVKWKGYDNSFNSWINKKRHSVNENTKSFRAKRESWIRFV